MVIRYVVGFGLLLAASAAYGNGLQITYEGQVPENVVVEGVPVTYTFHNLNVEHEFEDPEHRHGIGTGMQISVDGTVITPASGIFVANDDDNDGTVECDEDPAYSNAWKCDDLVRAGSGQAYSFTWTPPQAGTYLMDFHGFCQEMPFQQPPLYCDVNGGVPTVAYFATIVSVDTDGDGVGDLTDPDDDNDGIIDGLDTERLVANNDCSWPSFDEAVIAGSIDTEVTCAARVSIQVWPGTVIEGFPAHLRLIAPFIQFNDDFGALEDGLLTAITANPCPGCGGYEIGDEGPAGGIVFYVTDGGWHGLEAALSDQSPGAPWGCYNTHIEGADNYAFGFGAQNTAAILEQCVETGIAALVADSYSLNGFDDWFLPSAGEFSILIYNLHLMGVGDLVDDYYWTSTGNGATMALAADVGLGHLYIKEKFNTYRVRAIRAF